MENFNPPEYLIPITSDFGFKRAFADEKDTLFARKAIQVLASLQAPLQELRYTRNEQMGLTKYSRKGIIDVFCEDEHQQVFITEMQHMAYPFMFERLLYYLLLAFDKMVMRGDAAFSNVKPVHCICISSQSMLKEDGYYTKISLKNEANKTVFDKIQFYIVELSKFTKPINQCTSDLDKLLFTMKNGHKININDHSEFPPFWGEEWIENVLEKLKDANLTPNERMNYKIDLAQAAIERERYQQEIEEKIREKKEREELAAEVKNTKQQIQQATKEKQRVEQEKQHTEQQLEQAKQEMQRAEQEKQRVEERLEQSKETTMRETIATALNNGMSSEQIVQLLNYPKSLVLQVKEQLNAKN